MYCTLADLQHQVRSEVLERVASDENGQLQLDVIEYGISQAASEIDSYCCRYQLPLKNVPAVLQKYCVDMALFHIFSRQGFNFSEESEDYVIYLRYKMAIEYLTKVAKGVVELPGVNSGGSGISTGGTSNLRIASNKRLFSREQMKGY